MCAARFANQNTIDLDGTKIKVAIANGLRNADILMKQIEAGESPYTFIRV